MCHWQHRFAARRRACATGNTEETPGEAVVPVAAPLRRTAKLLVPKHQAELPIFSARCHAQKRRFRRRIASGRGKSVAPPGAAVVAEATSRSLEKKEVVPPATYASPKEEEVVPLAATLKQLEQRLVPAPPAKKGSTKASCRWPTSCGKEIKGAAAGASEFVVKKEVVRPATTVSVNFEGVVARAPSRKILAARVQALLSTRDPSKGSSSVDAAFRKSSTKSSSTSAAPRYSNGFLS